MLHGMSLGDATLLNRGSGRNILLDFLGGKLVYFIV
jgi:hypothetical protein